MLSIIYYLQEKKIDNVNIAINILRFSELDQRAILPIRALGSFSIKYFPIPAIPIIYKC